jgi:hypothetical protein
MMRKVSRVCTSLHWVCWMFIRAYWPKLLIWSLMNLTQFCKSESERGTAYSITQLSRLNRRWVKREQIGLTSFRARIRKPAVLIQLSQKKIIKFFSLYNIESEFCDVIAGTEQKLFRYKRAPFWARCTVKVKEKYFKTKHRSAGVLLILTLRNISNKVYSYVIVNFPTSLR